MRNKKVDALIHQMENYSECWKQFSRYLNAARSKHFDQSDETQFLELKSLITQELELILAAVECSSPKKVEVHSLLGSAPSIRYLSELSEGALRGLENQRVLIVGARRDSRRLARSLGEGPWAEVLPGYSLANRGSRAKSRLWIGLPTVLPRPSVLRNLCLVRPKTRPSMPLVVAGMRGSV